MARKNLDRFSQVKPTINFYSKKNRSLMFCESYVEVGALLELEFDPTISRYVTQPISFQLYRGNRKTRYTPDILVKAQDGSFWYEEVKSENKAKLPKFIEDHHFHASALLEGTGVPLKLRISDAPHRCTYRQNLKYLYRFLDYGFDSQELGLFQSVDQPTALGRIHRQLRARGLSKIAAFAALAQGLLGFNKKVRVNDDLIVLGDQ